ncbi:MAG: hypothetical protein IIC51_04500, partial [Planctomycetes bacterium]|nr:hypothetical protein [Planctomycetota bacterium]
LPRMPPPIVVAFLWRQFYDKSETGVLNQMFGPVADGFITRLTIGQ